MWKRKTKAVEAVAVNPLVSRARGALLGLAVGDALGAPVEFKPFGSFEPVAGYRAGGPFDLPAGYWTDDTSMALCLADSLIEQRGYDSYDVMGRYVQWIRNGYRSSVGYCFDVGSQTAKASRRYRENPFVRFNEQRTQHAGNAPAMRLAPASIVAVASQLNPERTADLHSFSARETHYSLEAEEATVVFGHLLTEALRGVRDKHTMQDGFDDVDGFYLIPHLRNIGGTPAAELPNSGYIRHTVAAAWWAFINTDNFEDGVFAAVNLGDDADTVGAVYGQLAGAYYGEGGIPEWMVRGLHDHDMIAGVAEQLTAVTDFEILRTRFEEDGPPFAQKPQ